MSPPFEAYLAPAVPLVTRALLCLRWSWLMLRPLPEEAQERDLSRTFVLSLAGFSFTAVAGLAVLDAAVRITLQLPTWYVLLSFVAYVGSFNLQSYKTSRGQNQLATGLVETGTLSLMLAVVALVFSASFETTFQWAAATITLGAWLTDHLLRLRLDHRYLDELNAAICRGATK